MRRKALIVGINHYQHAAPLSGCVNDARALSAALEYHGNGEKNFSVRLLTAENAEQGVCKAGLRRDIADLFDASDVDTVLFYFAGHGTLKDTGGYLWTSDCEQGDEGVLLTEIVDRANRSRVKNRIVILDSCRSGFAGLSPKAPSYSEISEGLTILAASTAEQDARESNGSGVFTALLVDGLLGGAANLSGDVTIGGLYAHIDQALGPWEQRPVLKSHVQSFFTLRKVAPTVPLESLRQMVKLFPRPDYDLQLDPSFEPTSAQPDPSQTLKFAILQQYHGANLVVPVGERHMYYAAIHSKCCRLTPLGKHYWRLVSKKQI